MLSYLEKNKSTNQEINYFLNNLFTIYNQHLNDNEDDYIYALIDSDIDLKNSDFKEMFFILNKVIRDWYVDNIDNNLKEKSKLSKLQNKQIYLEYEKVMILIKHCIESFKAYENDINNIDYVKQNQLFEDNSPKRRKLKNIDEFMLDNEMDFCLIINNIKNINNIEFLFNSFRKKSVNPSFVIKLINDYPHLINKNGFQFLMKKLEKSFMDIDSNNLNIINEMINMLFNKKYLFNNGFLIKNIENNYLEKIISSHDENQNKIILNYIIDNIDNFKEIKDNQNIIVKMINTNNVQEINIILNKLLNKNLFDFNSLKNINNLIIRKNINNYSLNGNKDLFYKIMDLFKEIKNEKEKDNYINRILNFISINKDENEVKFLINYFKKINCIKNDEQIIDLFKKIDYSTFLSFETQIPILFNAIIEEFGLDVFFIKDKNEKPLIENIYLNNDIDFYKLLIIKNSCFKDIYFDELVSNNVIKENPETLHIKKLVSNNNNDLSDLKYVDFTQLNMNPNEILFDKKLNKYESLFEFYFNLINISDKNEYNFCKNNNVLNLILNKNLDLTTYQSDLYKSKVDYLYTNNKGDIENALISMSMYLSNYDRKKFRNVYGFGDERMDDSNKINTIKNKVHFNKFIKIFNDKNHLKNHQDNKSFIEELFEKNINILNKKFFSMQFKKILSLLLISDVNNIIKNNKYKIFLDNIINGKYDKYDYYYDNEFTHNHNNVYDIYDIYDIFDRNNNLLNPIQNKMIVGEILLSMIYYSNEINNDTFLLLKDYFIKLAKDDYLKTKEMVTNFYNEYSLKFNNENISSNVLNLNNELGKLVNINSNTKRIKL